MEITVPTFTKESYNILLVMPKLNVAKEATYPFILGIAYISSVLKLTGFNVKTLNLNHYDSIEKPLKQHIRDYYINAVAVGGLSQNYNVIREILRFAREEAPEITTVVGGGLIISQPEIAMEALEIADFGVIGEGEVTVCELFGLLEKAVTQMEHEFQFDELVSHDVHGSEEMRTFAELIQPTEQIGNIAGLIYRDGDTFVTTAKRAVIADIDRLPFADYEGFGYGEFLAHHAQHGVNRGANSMREIPISLGRSCAYNCTFCFRILGHRYRTRSIENIEAELKFLIERYQVDSINIVDEMFAKSEERIFALCDLFKKYDLKWLVDTRLELITLEIAIRMKESGCIMVVPGVESGDNRILKSMRKGITIEQITKSLDNIYKAGLPTYAHLIFGDINETIETAETTLRWAEEHTRFKVNLLFIYAHPGSYNYNYACETGLIKDKIQFLKDGCPTFNFSKLTDEEYHYIRNVRIPEVINKYVTETPTMEKMTIRRIHQNTGQLDITGDCPQCGASVDLDEIDIFCSLHLFYKYCLHCHKHFSILCPEELRPVVKENLEEMIERHGKIAIWGSTTSIMLHRMKSDLFDSAKIHFVEDGFTRFGKVLDGRHTHDSAIIAQERIQAIVMVPLTNYFPIIQRIRDNKLPVQKYIFVKDLIFPHTDRIYSIPSSCRKR